MNNHKIVPNICGLIAGIILLLSDPASATPPGIFAITIGAKAGPQTVAGETSGEILLTSRIPIGNTEVTLCLDCKGSMPPQYRIPAGNLEPQKTSIIPFTLPLGTIGVHTIGVDARGKSENPNVSGRIYPEGRDYFFLLRAEHKATLLTESELKKSLNGKRPAPESGQWGKPVQGLQAFIAPLKTTYHKGEPLKFSIALQNISSTPIHITELNLGSITWYIGVETYVRAGVPPNQYWQGIGFSFPVGGAFFKDGFKTLAPGEKWTREVTLTDKKGLEELAKWPNIKFEYRLEYVVEVFPFFEEAIPEKIWQGHVYTQGDGTSIPGPPIHIE